MLVSSTDSLPALAAGAAGSAEHRARARFEIATALEREGKFNEAVLQLREAAALDPRSGEVQINLAALLEKTDQLEEALTIAHRAVELQPGQAIAQYNLASVLQSMGKLQEAIAVYSSAIQLDPQFALAFANRGCCRLLKGEYAAGWPDYEWRLRTGQVQVDRYPQPRWDGRPLPSGTLLIHGEQGIGDEIQFASCIPEVVPTVGKCVFVCHPRLAKLMARSFPAVGIVGHPRQPSRAAPIFSAAIDAQISSGSMPMYLRRSLGEFPSRKRFLLADPTQKQQWRRRFAELGPGLKIGISWRGGGTADERRKRTTTLAQWRDMLHIPGVHFINLQYGDCAAELAAARQDCRATIHDFAEASPLEDLDDFAAKVAALDLVISIGNATVHLAGALGVPTWCLAPFVPQWRWGMNGEQTPWYPSVRIIRQTARGDWTTALAEVARLLQTGVAHGHDAIQRSAQQTTVIINAPQKTAVDFTRPVVAQQASAGDAQSAKQLLQQAAQHFNENRWEEAGRMAEQVLRFEAKNIVAIRIVAVAARKAQQFDRSLELFERAIELAPTNPIFHFERGLTLTEMKRHREAFECFVDSTKFQPPFQPAFVNISAILEQQERFEEALSRRAKQRS